VVTAAPLIVARDACSVDVSGRVWRGWKRRDPGGDAGAFESLLAGGGRVALRDRNRLQHGLQ